MPSDRWAPRPVVRHDHLVTGKKWDVVVDEFLLEEDDRPDDADAVRVRREYLEHPGAVSVLAMDDEERVLLLRQYRHPARHELWELPAGLLDGQRADDVAGYVSSVSGG